MQGSRAPRSERKPAIRDTKTPRVNPDTHADNCLHLHASQRGRPHDSDGSHGADATTTPNPRPSRAHSCRRQPSRLRPSRDQSRQNRRPPRHLHRLSWLRQAPWLR
ncbi:unnamed protein product, partial [Ectocarpus sp. 12 AP-2014]